VLSPRALSDDDDDEWAPPGKKKGKILVTNSRISLKGDFSSGLKLSLSLSLSLDLSLSLFTL